MPPLTLTAAARDSWICGSMNSFLKSCAIPTGANVEINITLDARVAGKIADRRMMLARYHLASLLAFLVRTSGTRPYKRFKMAVFLHDRLRRNIYRRKLLQRARPIPRKSMDRQVCASYICFLIYLVAHWKTRISRPAWTVPGQRSRAAIKPKRKLFYLMTLSASMFGEIVRPICFTVFKLITNSNLVGYSKGGETDRDTALAGRLLSKVPHNAIDRCLTRAGQEQHQRACQ